MNHLEKKYRENNLTKTELKQLRQQINSMSEKDIEREMYDVWINENIDNNVVEDEFICTLKTNIDNTISSKQHKLPLAMRILQISASILLPIFIAFTVYLYTENKQIMKEEMVVATGKGERVSITLPDGSLVLLNSESELAYSAKNYNKQERKIDFKGEGYFKISQNRTAPFIISAEQLRVEVLGTTFNLRIRENDSIAELSLEEGKVLFTSITNNSNVILEPLQKGILNRITGEITVVSNKNTEDQAAWRHNNIVFRAIALHSVVSELEKLYNISIAVDCKECLSDKFTGTLPTNNLKEALNLIELSFHLKAINEGQKVILKKK